MLKKLLAAFWAVLLCLNVVNPANAGFFGPTNYGDGRVGGAVFDPESISDLVFWVDGASASSGATFTWANKASTGSTYNFVQATAAKQPVILTDWVNGKPVVRFNGAKALQNTSSPGGKDITRNVNGVTYFIAYQAAVPESNQNMIFFATPSPTFGSAQLTNQYISFSGGKHVMIGRNIKTTSNGVLTPGTAITDVGDMHVVTGVGDYLNRGATIRLDGSTIGTAADGTWTFSGTATENNPVGDATIGGAYNSGNFDGVIAEILIYNRELTSDEYTSVENYLINKYEAGQGNFGLDPSEMPQTLAWWRADQGVTLNGSDVQTWTDIINGYQLTQATGSAQPTPTTSSALNSQAVFDFDGNDYFISTDTNLKDIGGKANSDGLTIVVVMETSNNTGNQTLLTWTIDTGTSNRVAALISTGLNLQWFNRMNNDVDSRNLLDTGGSYTGGDAFVAAFHAVYNGGRGTIYKNGAIEANNATLFTAADKLENSTPQNFSVCGTSTGGNPFEGKIAEIIVMERLTNDEYNQILHPYLEARYNLTMTDL